MAEPAKLTKQAIDRFTYSGGWDVRWDTEVTGLGVRIYPTGKKSFVLSFRTRGPSPRKRLMVLGRYGVLTLHKAREMARTELAAVIGGGDPLASKNARKREVSVRELIEAYLEGHAKIHKRTWAEDERRLHRHVPTKWLRRTPSEISREDVRNLHASIGANAPYEANRVLALLKVVFKFARLEGFVEADVANPAVDIRPYREKSRKRFASPAEIQALASAIDEEPNIFIRGLVWLYLLTGARKSELLTRQWSDIDWDRRCVCVPETKSGEPQTIPLNAQALAILQALPRLDGNPYVFPGAVKGRPLVNIAKAWRRMRDRAGVADLRLHDLRRTVGSWMTQSGTELNTIKEALRHQQISTTLIYARTGDDVARDALEDHGRRVMSLVGSVRPAGQS